MDSLPTEIWSEIISYCNGSTLKNIRLVGASMAFIANNSFYDEVIFFSYTVEDENIKSMSNISNMYGNNCLLELANILI